MAMTIEEKLAMIDRKMASLRAHYKVLIGRQGDKAYGGDREIERLKKQYEICERAREYLYESDQVR